MCILFLVDYDVTDKSEILSIHNGLEYYKIMFRFIK